MKKIITYALYLIAFTSLFIASGIKDIPNWWDIARPFFIVFTVSIVVASILTYINKIRRITYPMFVCVSAWVYQHRVIRNDFTKKTYKLYKWQNRSYQDLFDYVQDVFDVIYT